MIITPGQFSKRSAFYYQLAQLTSAGLSILSTLEQLRRNPPSQSFRRPLQQVITQLEQGGTFTEAVKSVPHWLPEFDIALIQAGENSGRLDASFKLLADYYRDRAQMTRQMIGDLAYPAFLFHFAIFIFPFAQFFTTGNLLVYLTKTFGVLIPVYVVIGVLIYAGQSKHGESWRSKMEAILRWVPILGKARFELALARLATALEALISAGVNIVEAWGMAANASGSPFLRRTVLSWRPQLEFGKTPAEIVLASGIFPELFANQYSSGEISGKLDETLQRLHKYYQEQGMGKLRALSQWVPRFVYLMIVLMIAYRIVSFYSGYVQQIRDAGGF